MQYRLVDAQGKVLTDQHGPGELQVRGPTVFKGYWKQPELTAAVLDAQGWLSTGYLIRVDDDGFAYFMGRSKDMIKTGGENVASLEVENYLIGLGFMLMKIGSLSTQPGWLILPGCVLAGIGLSLTNTTTTNTIMASVAAERSGMASGADTSARMISLAFNIALMGFILVEGIMTYLRNIVKIPEDVGLRLFEEKIAAGDVSVLDQNAVLLSHITAPGEAIYAALMSRFGWVITYGAVSAFLLALGSFLIFSPGKTAQRDRNAQGTQQTHSA